METIPEISEILLLDKQIVEFLEKRLILVKTIQERLSSCGATVNDVELTQLANVLALPESVFERQKRHELFQLILGFYRPFLEPAKLRCACLGDVGSFSHLAANRCFGPTAEYDLCNSMRFVFDLVASSQANYGVVALANSTSGNVHDNIALLTEFSTKGVRICREFAIKIEHALLVKDDIGKVKRIHSHEQALKQCEKKLALLVDELGLDSVEIIPFTSSTAAAKLASVDVTVGAIANGFAAKVWNLKI